MAGRAHMARYQRHSPRLKQQLVNAYLAGQGSYRALALAHGIDHSLLVRWVQKMRRGVADQAAALAITPPPRQTSPSYSTAD